MKSGFDAGDFSFSTRTLNDTPILRGTRYFELSESDIEGMSIHRPRTEPCACDLVEAWLEGDNYDYPESRVQEWKQAAETFLETRRKRYSLVQHQDLLVRAFERYLRRNGYI